MKNKKTGKKPETCLPDCEKLAQIVSSVPHPLNLDAIIRLAHAPRKSKKNLLACLRELTRQRKLVKPSAGLWASADSLKSLEGQFDALLNGGGFVKTGNSGGEEFFIHPDDVNEAWHNDIVRIAILPSRGHEAGRARRGRVLEVLKRTLKNIPVQYIKRTGRTMLCRPVDGRLHFNVSVCFPPGEEFPPGLAPGHLLLVSPKKRIASNLYDAAMVEILGRENDVKVQEDMVKLSHGVPRVFPAKALARAASLPDEPLAADMKNREDMSEVPFVTIDGADAKDFDDAIQVCRENGKWLLRVAIADVSHYVRPDGEPDGLDAEALRRGNSWYFPTSVEPMLPKELSNGLCSLAPLQKRLAMLVEIPFDSQGAPGKPRFAPIVMQSWGRLIYEDVQHFFDNPGQKILARGKNPLRDADQIGKMLGDAHELYKILARVRKERGTLDFDLPEPQYSFAEDGSITGVRNAERNDAHKLIEEFMITANEAVARHLSTSKIPFLYRVHPAPEETRLAALFATLQATAVKNLPAGIIKNGQPAEDALQKIIAASFGTPAEYVVNRLCLRAMQQARYQPENIGHFGLASKAYCHFTSPIRRYADLLVHRALKSDLGEAVGKNPTVDELQDIGNQLNVLERKAMECEREMTRRMGCLLLQGHEGEVFDASVSGVTDFGIFVELASMPLEGLIRLDDLAYDWFELDAKAQCLIGQKTGQIWKLGQAARVRLEKADMARLEMRFLPEKMDRYSSGLARKRRGRQTGERNGRKSGKKHSGNAKKPAAQKAQPAKRSAGKTGKGGKKS